VAYLNGSKVLTTGSALAFDGTNFSTSNSMRVTGSSASYASGAGAEITYVSASTKGGIQVYDRTASAYRDVFLDGANVLFQISGSEKMRIDSSGNLGIGETSPAARLDLKSSATDFTGVILNNTSTSGKKYNIVSAGSGSYFDIPTGAFGIRDLTAGATRLVIDSSGNLLVGTTSATGTLTVKGTSTARAGTVISLTDSSAGNLFKIANDGLITTGGAANPYGNTTATGANAVFAADGVFYRSTSALKYKQDIRDIESIDIAKFRPIRYKSKCNGDDQTLDHFGIVADEVDQAGIKELVSYGIDGQVEGFQYERLTVVLLKAIQEQQALITQLTARITALESA
jgi:hypothetical protein